MGEVTQMPAVEIIPIEACKPYWRNPRKNDKAVPAVMASIQQFGVLQPLVVDKKGIIVVGHTRYRAMMELGIKEVPVVRALKLTAKQVTAYRIADNKTNELAEWRNDALIPELRDTDLSVMGLFYEEADLAKLLGSDMAEFNPVSAEEMDRVLNHQQGHGPGSPRADAMVKLTCPHCSEDFFVDRSTILTGRGEE